MPSTLRKSSSATPDVNLGTLLLDIPVSWVEDDPKPKEVLAVEPLSATKLDPFPTIKLPSVTPKPATSCNCASSLALATVPVSWLASMVLLVSVWVSVRVTAFSAG